MAVFAVGHRPPSPHARAMAAVLACGPGAVLSHRSAGALWGLTRWPAPIEVTAPTCHRHDGLLARVLDPTSLTRAVNDARLRHLVKIDAETGPTRSVFEDACLAFLARHGLPR